jgi:uncharacterized protein (DUF427 family)
MAGYPAHVVAANHVEAVPRRVRATLAGTTVLDTTAALYVWEFPPYPQFYIPLADIDPALLVDEEHPERLSRGSARRHGLRVGNTERPGAAHVYLQDALYGLAGMVRLEWSALDAWFEEDEQVFVHPRSPYVRVDALRASRSVRVELDGLLLAESPSPVLVFETGLPTRFYLDRSHVDFAHLIATDTVTACPYKGRTSGYWSAQTPRQLHPDLAWTYDFPTRELLPIAGLIAFYNERVDLTVDGQLLARPQTPFSS